jgi:predicted TIM-barrel fold metal-dependent hydrolase
MIIDAHVHIFPPGVISNREAALKGEAAFSLLYADPGARLAKAEDLIAFMDRDGIDRAVVCGFPWKDPGRARDHNDYILAAAAEFRDRITPLAACDPSAPGGLKEAERALGAGAAGLGELGFYLSDLAEPKVQEALIKAAGLCSETRRPLLLHTNEPVGHAYPGKSPMTLSGLYRLVRACPRTAFQLAHLGGGIFFYELLKKEVKETLANCVFDTAAAPFLYRPELYPAFARLAGEDRLLMGTDWPLLGLGRYLKDLDSAGVEGRFKERLLGGNALEFYGLR